MTTANVSTADYTKMRPTSIEVTTSLHPDSERRIKSFAKEHLFDPNLDGSLYRRLAEEGSENVEDDVGDSRYPEVRAAVLNTDDSNMPCNTLRMWTIALFFTTVGAGINMLLSLRQPSIVITSIVTQLISFPLGKAWERYLPDWELKLFRLSVRLNPGPFNIKEHTLITIAGNISYGNGIAYATDILLAQKIFYGQQFGGTFAVLLVISTQCLGYSFAGITRRFLVWPASMIWPSNLTNATLFHTLFRAQDPLVPDWKISRYRFFMYCFIGMFIWTWIPGYIFPALSNFAFITWIKPDDIVVNQLFGSFTGLDLIPLTVDWSQVTGYLSSPLMTPFWAIGNIFVGFVFWIWFITPILHFTNTWYGKYMPISTSISYDNTGQKYNFTRILNDQFEFDLAKYKNYSPLFLGTTFALSYGLSFAAITSVIVHVYLFHGTQIWQQLRNQLLTHEDDIHMKLNRRYKQVPDWWFVLLGVIMLGIAIGVCEGWETQLPWWGLGLAIAIALLFFIPLGIIQAISNFQLGLNVITELVAGYVFPGKPIANMTFKVYGYMAMSKGLSFSGDLKLGHYMHISPMMLFSVQILATIWGGLVDVGVLYWAFNNISGICTSHAVQNFTCPKATTFFTNSVVWGAVGPQRMFGRSQIYEASLYFFLIGAIAPIPIYILARLYPSGKWKFVNTTLFFFSTASIPPATAINYATWSIVGFIFNFFIKRRHSAWWAKYNYVTSAALDCGLAISLIVIFLTLSLPNAGVRFDWWGSSGAFDTAVSFAIATLTLKDFHGIPILRPNVTFGPTTW